MIDLAHKSKKTLQEKVSLSILIDLLYSSSQGGGTHKIAYAILEKIRDEGLEETNEDRILELMSFVSGFCSQDKRIQNESDY